MQQLIAQAVGFLALFLVILSFQNGKRVKILLLMLCGVILFVFHYGLLGAWVGSVMNLVEAGMIYVAYKKQTAAWARSKLWLYGFILLFALAGAATAHGWIDVLPIVAQIFGAIAVWQISPRAIRFIMLAPRPLWFIYNLIVGSYAGLAGEVFVFLSVVIGIVRFDILKQKEK